MRMAERNSAVNHQLNRLARLFGEDIAKALPKKEKKKAIA